MGEIYVSSKGEQVDVTTMNSFRLVNGLVQNATALGKEESEQARSNVQVLSKEIIARLDTRTPEEKAQ